MADTSDFITGCDGSEIPPYEPGEDCPPGSTWGCCPDAPDFPLTAPNTINCSTIQVSQYMANLIGDILGEYIVTKPDNARFLLRDKNGIYIEEIFYGYQMAEWYSVEQLIDETVFLYCQGAIQNSPVGLGVYKVNLQTYETTFLTESNDNSQGTGWTLSSIYSMNANEYGNIVLSGGNATIEGVYAADIAVALNANGDYLFYDPSCRGGLFLDNNIVITSYFMATDNGFEKAGRPLHAFTADGTPLPDLFKPTADATNESFGQYMYDLHVFNGLGLFCAVHYGDYWQNVTTQNKVSFYNYDLGYIATLTSPLTTGANTKFGCAVQRYGNFIYIGELTCLFQGITTGVIHIYDEQLNYIKTISPYNVDGSNNTGHNFPQGISVSDTTIVSGGIKGGSVGLIKVCEYD